MIIYKTAGDDDDDGENSGAGEDGEGMAAGDVHGLMGGGDGGISTGISSTSFLYRLIRHECQPQPAR